ncbi:hypothetical protein T10_8747 [Trichinella papuae]|uniref:DUF5641 domain-containing protein n=1 Tax=Trichinella papuae TaxID=268474 RepID=A0A0V1MCP9_9BILA|nr:hypothetical protein T10_8747 [Trichinella papuae]
MECVKELKHLTETTGFCLTKWSSNEAIVLRSLLEKDVASECKAIMALGIVWNNKGDIITFPVIRVARPDQQMTERGMLSVIMKVFDPLGYLSPFLVKARHMLQALWRKGIDWDILLSQNMLKDWQDWIAVIPSISEIRLPRCLLPVRTDCIKEVELHGYGDASEMAYESTVYLRITTVLGETIANLVMSKTRIAPVKRVTLLRLELMAALITARLLSFVKTSLEIKFSRVVCWTDSQIAIRWIQRDSYSSLTKLFTVTAYVFRFISNCKVTPDERKTTPLDVREIDQAEQFWLKTLQNEEFPEELELLKQERKLQKSSRLWPLNPYIDDNGILRYPVLLSNQHPLVKLLVRDQHIRHLHAGVDQTLSCLRQRYWIVNGRSIVKRVIKEYVTCRKKNAKPFLPKMSDLPRERVVEVSPFENTDLDLAGPLRNLDELVRETHSTLTSKRIKWKYITPRAPWCGKYWQCLVRSVKTALRKALGRTSLDEEELGTVLCGIEVQLIERVNAVTFSDRKSFGRCALRPKSSRTNDGYHRKSNKAMALKLIAHFWKGWRSEYIATFCTRLKWRSDSIEPNGGDIVLIAEENVNKGRWMMGRVLELFYGRDGIVRSVQLKVANGEMTRPMKKLRLLEAAIVDGVPQSSGEDVTDSNRI